MKTVVLLSIALLGLALANDATQQSNQQQFQPLEANVNQPNFSPVDANPPNFSPLEANEQAPNFAPLEAGAAHDDKHKKFQALQWPLFGGGFGGGWRYRRFRYWGGGPWGWGGGFYGGGFYPWGGGWGGGWGGSPYWY